MNPTHAIVTAAIHDMNGFAELGQITVEEYEAAETYFACDATGDFDLLLDLWTKEGHTEDKYVSKETAAGLLNWETAEIEQRARQMLAQINDEDDEYCRARRSIIQRSEDSLE